MFGMQGAAGKPWTSRVVLRVGDNSTSSLHDHGGTAGRDGGGADGASVCTGALELVCVCADLPPPDLPPGDGVEAAAGPALPRLPALMPVTDVRLRRDIPVTHMKVGG